MTSITDRNAQALIERNGTTLPKATPAKKAPRKTVAKGNDQAAKVVAPSNEAPTPVQCRCSCGYEAKFGRSYLPGHDARHAGQVGRALVANAEGAQEQLKALPPKLAEKARRFQANAAAKAERQAKAAAIRANAKAAMKAELAAL